MNNEYFTPPNVVQKNIVIATPTHSDMLPLQFVTSAFSVCNTNHMLNMPYTTSVYFRRGSLVNRCRNELLAYFLESTNLDYIFFIDSDIVNFDKAYHYIVQRYFELEQKLPDIPFILGAAYPIKHYNFDVAKDTRLRDWVQGTLNYNINHPHLYTENEPLILQEASRSNGIVEVTDIGGGFMMFSKKTLMKMIQTYPDTKYKRFFNNKNIPEDTLYNLFHSFVDKESGYYLSEDYGFCYLLRNMGGRIFADITVELNHLGDVAFSGSLMKSLQVQQYWETSNILFGAPYNTPSSLGAHSNSGTSSAFVSKATSERTSNHNSRNISRAETPINTSVYSFDAEDIKRSNSNQNSNTSSTDNTPTNLNTNTNTATLIKASFNTETLI